MPLFEHVASAKIKFNKGVVQRDSQFKVIPIIKRHIANADSLNRVKLYKELYRKYFTIDKPLSVDRLYHYILLFSQDDYCDHLWDLFCTHINQFVENYR